MKKIKIINYLLVIVVVLSLIWVFSPSDSLISFFYSADPEEPQCFFLNKGEMREIVDISRCCYELQKQLVCEGSDLEGFDYQCYTSKGSWSYLVNNKAFLYCVKEGYYVQKT